VHSRASVLHLEQPEDFMSEMDKLFEHIDDIEMAMLTTRPPDGHLCSRAMATQKRAAGADLWFVTLDDSGKLGEIAFDQHVNLAYYKDRTREWVSISGIATITGSRKDPRIVGAGLAGVVSEGRRSEAWNGR
jgi:general stress protein 26